MSTTTAERIAPRASHRAAPAPIPMSRIVGVELRKMFDTRSGFWLMTSIGLVSVVATGAVILWAPHSELTFSTFATAIGFPMAVILPMVAVLSVTSERTQRSGLTTFALVPHRGRVIGAKLIGVVAVGIVSTVVAFVVGAFGNVVGTALTGVHTTWNISPLDLGLIIVGNILGMLVGFMLGVLIRNSPGAIVSYFVYGFVAPTLFEVLAAHQQWFADLRGWVDFNFAQSALFNGDVSAHDWAQIGVSGLLWLAIPLAIGLRLVLRSEVK